MTIIEYKYCLIKVYLIIIHNKPFNITFINK